MEGVGIRDPKISCGLSQLGEGGPEDSCHYWDRTRRTEREPDSPGDPPVDGSVVKG